MNNRIQTQYSVTWSAGYYTIAYSGGVYPSVIFASASSGFLNHINTNWFYFGQPGNYTLLDFNLCTSPSGSTSVANLQAAIVALNTSASGVSVPISTANGGTGQTNITFPTGPDRAMTYADSYSSNGHVTVKNKLIDNSNALCDATDNTKLIYIDPSTSSTGCGTTLSVHSTVNGRNITFPDATDTLVGRATTDTLKNKTIDSSCVLSDATDTTKQVAVSVSGATTGTKTTLNFNQASNASLTFPPGTDTVVTLGATQTLTSKTLTSPIVTYNSTTYNAAATLTAAQSGTMIILDPANASASFIIQLPALQAGLNFIFSLKSTHASYSSNVNTPSSQTTIKGIFVKNTASPTLGMFTGNKSISFVAGSQTVGDWMEMTCDGVSWVTICYVQNTSGISAS